MSTKGLTGSRLFVTLIGALALAAWLLVSCTGGAGTTPVAAGAGSADPAAQVDPALWDQLTTELARVIEAEGTAKRTSAAPVGFGSRVPDLSVHEDGGQAVFSWSYRQHGDYDLNGEVNVSDLTQVGVHFGKNTLSDDWQQAQLADGDGNGEVNVSDVTPIGQNFGGRIDGYELQGRVDSASEYLLKADLDFVAGDKLAGIYPGYEYISAPLPLGPEYRVVPYVDDGDGRAYGLASNLYQTTHNTNNHWHTKHGNNSRDNLAHVAGPVTDAQTWEVPLEGSVFLQEPIVDPGGDIYIGAFLEGSIFSLVGDGYFYSISQDGEVNWRQRTNYGIATTAAASRNGRIVTGDIGGVLYCLAPDGKQHWRRQLPGLIILSSPMIDDVGNVFVVSQTVTGDALSASTLFMIKPDGTTAWSRPLDDTCPMTPFFNSQHEATVVDDAGELYSFDYAGVMTQNFMLPDPPLSGFPGIDMTIRGPAILYSTSNDRVRAVLEDNSATTFISLGESGVTGPSISATNNIILVSATIAPDPVNMLNHYTGGIEDWDMALPGNFVGGVAVDPDGNMFVSTFLAEDVVPPGTNGISRILPDQTIAWFYPTDDKAPFAPVIADDNLLLCVLSSSLLGSDGQVSLLGIRGN
ncbi:PQQ-binding-like beta-propeller repeat protein [bacterium]|nr:PQQ-binding-like beta-propeller repeat protein [bacterium]